MSHPTKGPLRLRESSSSPLARELLRSARADAAPAHSRVRALATASVLASTVAASGTATAGVLSTATLSVLKWFGAGVLTGAASMGAAEILAHPSPPAAENHAGPGHGAVVAPARPDRPKPATAELADLDPETPALAPPVASFASTPSSRSKLSPPPLPAGETASATLAERPASSIAFAPAPSALARGPATTPDDFAAQLALVDRARRVVAANNPTLALELLDRLEREHGTGRFGPEATVIRIEALVRGGNRPLAETLADRFIGQHPSHPLVPRVRSLISTGGPTR